MFMLIIFGGSMKTLNQLEQEAQQAREEATKELSEYVPNAIEVADKLILASVAMVTYQFALGMENANQIWNESGTKVLSEKIISDVNAVEVMQEALNEIERNTCSHEETHRGGVIWEICDQCGAKWADDEGGKPEFVELKIVTKLKDCIKKMQHKNEASQDQKEIDADFNVTNWPY